MSKGEGALEASMIKAYVCRTAEWVTREALQIHGGMGYAEEYPVSRYFVDARVLSIFEGADETLCLKVIARRLLAEQLTGRRRRPAHAARSESCGSDARHAVPGPVPCGDGRLDDGRPRARAPACARGAPAAAGTRRRGSRHRTPDPRRGVLGGALPVQRRPVERPAQCPARRRGRPPAAGTGAGCRMRRRGGRRVAGPAGLDRSPRSTSPAPHSDGPGSTPRTPVRVWRTTSSGCTTT